MQRDLYTLDTPQKIEFDVLLSIWESSVRATHHFLKTEDIQFFKRIIQERQIFDLVSLTCVRDVNDDILGFMGVSGQSLEMIFLDPRAMGKGIGKILLRYAIDNLGVTKVDVNEQNHGAFKFYEHFGFKTVSRSELDETGKPYPILHMQLTKR